MGQLSPEFFQARLAQIQAHPDRELMLVVEDVATGIICGTGTLVVEPKFIHSAGLAGHLEDLVIDNGLRRKGLGRRIVQELLRFAEQAQCYKVPPPKTNKQKNHLQKKKEEMRRRKKPSANDKVLVPGHVTGDCGLFA